MTGLLTMFLIVSWIPLPPPPLPPANKFWRPARKSWGMARASGDRSRRRAAFILADPENWLSVEAVPGLL